VQLSLNKIVNHVETWQVTFIFIYLSLSFFFLFSWGWFYSKCVSDTKYEWSSTSNTLFSTLSQILTFLLV